MQIAKKASFDIVGLERLLDCMATVPATVEVETHKKEKGVIVTEAKIGFATSGLFKPIEFVFKKYTTDPKYKPGILSGILGHRRSLNPSYTMSVVYGKETEYSKSAGYVQGVAGTNTEFSALANAFNRFNNLPLGLTVIDTPQRIGFISDLKRILY